MQLQDYKEIEGILICDEGLKVGGGKEAAGIGETDNPVIRHPITRLPYIPGSSLKGKIRSLIEWRLRPKCQENGKPCSCGECDVCLLFGSDDIKTTKGPSRLIFRDSKLTPEWVQKLAEAIPGSYVEEKTEIAMDRKTGATRHGSLRQQERVPEGTEFHFSFVMRLFDIDNKRRPDLWKLLAQAIDDLEHDYLGGCGTRGYGKVRLLTPDRQTRLAEFLRTLS